MEKFLEFTNIFKDRLNNPLTISFIISWCVWNYEFIMIILSNNTVSTTISLIKQYSFPNICSSISKGIIYPAISTVIYIFIYPYPSKFTIAFTLRRNKEIAENRNAIEKTTLLTREESNKLREYYSREIQEYKEKNTNLNAEIESLQTTLRELKEGETPKPLDQNEKAERLKRESLLFLKNISEKINDRDYFMIQDIIEKYPKENYKLYLAYLEENGYVFKENKSGLNQYQIQSSGIIEISKQF